MYNQTVETRKFEVVNPQKYSLRSRHSHKITKDHPNPRIPPQQHDPQTETHLHPSETISQRSQISLKDETQSLELNCFDAAQKTWEMNRVPQMAFQSNYRTPSTTNSLQNHYKIGPLLDMNSLKTDGELKYSLKNCKKEPNSKVSVHLSHNGGRQMSDERHQQEQALSQGGKNGKPAEQRHSEVGPGSKFSLRTGAKKPSKPEVLLSLKYSDLLGLTRTLSNQNINIFLQPHQQPSRNNNFCTIARGNEEGCKCQPKCLWMNKWLNQVGETTTWNEGYRHRSEGEWQQSLKQIERDLPRTQPDHPAFQAPKLKQMMREVLIAYAQLDSEVGYVQGMNFVAAALVYHSRNSYDALKVFSYLMKECGYRRVFLGDLSLGRKIAGRLLVDLRRLVYDLYLHLTEEGIELELFASSWYFSLCGSFVPLDAMHIFIDKFLKKGFAGVNELLLTLLLHNKDSLLELEDSRLMLEFSNQKLYESGERIDWGDLRDRSDRLLLSPLQL